METHTGEISFTFVNLARRSVHDVDYVPNPPPRITYHIYNKERLQWYG